jgi:predicted nuclease of restriction endonuclease-like (RecB) superfamily
MNKPKRKASGEKPEELFGRIVSILEEARGNVLRAVNTNMVMAYWLIGREIVEEVQGGEERAAYGKKVIEELSARLNERYGQGFSFRNLELFKQFYLSYKERFTILRPSGAEFGTSQIVRPMGTDSSGSEITLPMGRKLEILSPPGIESGFSPQLSWSHYRALMRVNSVEAREFYEREAIAGGWDKRTLERQIQSFYYERLLKSPKPGTMLAGGRKRAAAAPCSADELKNPYVLEFLGLPNPSELHESDLEKAIITHLQRFLLELGNGFAFIARQKHIRMGEQDRYIDLVFYHIRLKFHLLIDLKVGELTHGDIGQMDGYVRMYDDLFAVPEDNPTIGLRVCTEKDDTVARYSVLNDRKQIFASKYMLCLPTEEQLRLEIEKERTLIEAALEERGDA